MDEKALPAIPIPPGEIISHELDARGWTQKDLAEITGRPEPAISEIINAKKQITPETAIQLAEAFGTSPELWTNLEMTYQLVLSRDKKREKDIARKSILYGLAPVGELLRRGWLNPTKSVAKLEKEVCSYLGVESPRQKPSLEASFRCSRGRQPNMNSLICWVNRVRRLAAEQNTSSFNRAKLERAIPGIVELSERVEDVEKVPEVLRSLGVHFLIVPRLQKTYLDGAAFHINGKPVVALTLKYDRIDSFWFTLMHELAHVVNGPKVLYLDDLSARTKDGEEIRANEVASDWLIDGDEYRSFVKHTRPYFYRQKIVDFARTQRRHPGIVLGRLQNDKHVPYSHLRDALLEKVGDHLERWIDAAG